MYVLIFYLGFFAGVSLRVEPVVFGQVLLCWLHGSDLEAMLLSEGHGTF